MTDVSDHMCPNCQTPWKCNGPHLSDQTSYVTSGRAARDVAWSAAREALVEAALAWRDEDYDAAKVEIRLEIAIDAYREATK